MPFTPDPFFRSAEANTADSVPNGKKTNGLGFQERKLRQSQSVPDTIAPDPFFRGFFRGPRLLFPAEDTIAVLITHFMTD
jgi:hypothetical protein